MTTTADARHNLARYLPNILLIIALSIAAFTRVRLFDIPLERDEGEYAYIGQLMLEGIAPYIHAYTMKLPGVAAAYAFFMAMFGHSPFGIHLGLLFVNAACIYSVYLLSLRLFDRNTALIASSFYTLLSLSQAVVGVHAHATHFVALFILAGSVLLFSYMTNRNNGYIFCSGLCLGIAFIMKQHAMITILALAAYLAYQYYRSNLFSKNAVTTGSILFGLGICLPYLLILAWMTGAGVFEEFWFWTVEYARIYASSYTLANAWPIFCKQTSLVIIPYLPVWLFAVAGGFLICKQRENASDRAFIGILLLGSALAVLPGFVFRNHYFIMMLPIVSIMAGLAVTNLTARITAPSTVNHLKEIVLFTLSLLLLCSGVIYERHYLFYDSPMAVIRSTYDLNPFPEAVAIATYIKKNTTANDRVAILGSEPEILFYADRIAATGHIYMYGLMEEQPYAKQMQLQAIEQIQSARPKYVVYVSSYSSWIMWPNSSYDILDWGMKFLNQNYDCVGIIDISKEGTNYVWEDKMTGDRYTPKSPFFISVYKRKPVQ